MIPASMMNLLSWNINGIRAASRRGFFDWLQHANPDILCLQEIRSEPYQLPLNLGGYYTYWNPSHSSGYSGTALLSRTKPTAVEYGFGITEFDREGRTIIAEYPAFTLITAYCPNGNSGEDRLAYKLSFYEALHSFCKAITQSGRNLVLCGDFNTAHKNIDLFDPASNRNRSGFLKEERKWIDQLISIGLVDSYRTLYPEETGAYTWWASTSQAKERNRGWRFDYLFLSHGLLPRLTHSFILRNTHLSDHCPIGVTLAPLPDSDEAPR